MIIEQTGALGSVYVTEPNGLNISLTRALAISPPESFSLLFITPAYKPHPMGEELTAVGNLPGR